MIVPYPAGGPTDTLARILAEHMKTSLGQPIIIENVSGAGGSIGVARVARAAPDGYTLSIGHWNTHVVLGATMNLSFDVLRDFEPIAMLADTPIWMVARKDLPPKNLIELIAWLKAKKARPPPARSASAAPPTSPARSSSRSPARNSSSCRTAARRRSTRTWSPATSTSTSAWWRRAIRWWRATRSRPTP